MQTMQPAGDAAWSRELRNQTETRPSCHFGRLYGTCRRVSSRDGHGASPPGTDHSPWDDRHGSRRFRAGEGPLIHAHRPVASRALSLHRGVCKE